MLNILRSYLDDSATPELRDSIIAAHQAFDRIEYPDYEKDFDEIIMLNDDSVNGDTLDSIVGMTKDIQRAILKEHEIVLSENADMDTATIFINAILDLVDYEDRDVLHDTATYEGSAEETFAELLTLVTDRTTDENLYDIDSVGQSLIARIKDISSNNLMPEVTSEDVEERETHINLLKRMVILAQTEDLHVVRMLTRDRMDVGYPFEIYVNHLGRELETLTPERAAQEFLGMALVSSDGMNNPRSVIKQHIEHCISNIDTITKIDIEIGKLLLGLQL